MDGIEHLTPQKVEKVTCRLWKVSSSLNGLGSLFTSSLGNLVLNKTSTLEFAHNYEEKIKKIEGKVKKDYKGVSKTDLINNPCRKCGLSFHIFPRSTDIARSTCYFCGFVQTVRKCQGCEEPTVDGPLCPSCEADMFEQLHYEDFKQEAIEAMQE